MEHGEKIRPLWRRNNTSPLSWRCIQIAPSHLMHKVRSKKSKTSKTKPRRMDSSKGGYEVWQTILRRSWVEVIMTAVAPHRPHTGPTLAPHCCWGKKCTASGPRLALAA